MTKRLFAKIELNNKVTDITVLDSDLMTDINGDEHEEMGINFLKKISNWDLWKQTWADGSQRKNYYVNESVGIASGFLLAAFHNAGLVTLTHTPSPMNFLGKILGRPENERAFLLIPVGYPDDEAEVPEITKKSFTDISKKV